jgi:hypothetical protein
LARGPLHVDELAGRTKTHAAKPVSNAARTRNTRGVRAGLAGRLRQYEGE